MKDAREEDGLRLPHDEPVPEMLRGARSAGCDHRNGDGFRDRASELEVVPATHAVAVDRGEEDFARASVHAQACPRNRFQVGALPSPVRVVVPRRAVARGIDRDHYALAPEPLRPAGQEVGIADRARVHAHLVGAGTEEGARLVAGGERDVEGAKARGNFLRPAVFAEVRPEMTIAQEEIFGPVMSIIPFKDIDEAIERGNRTMYGLAAAIWTRDISKAHRLAAELKAGTVWVNCYDVFDAAAPFGGFKMSGIGRELGEYALRNYTEVKTVTVAM